MKALYRLILPLIFFSPVFPQTISDGTRVTASDPLFDSYFGSSVAISDQFAVIGRPREQTSTGSGAVYVFRREGRRWLEEAKLTAPGGSGLTGFGASVALSGTRVVIGSPRAGAGTAYVFARNGGVWQRQAQLHPSVASERAGFGCAAAIDGKFIVIGAELEEIQSDTVGAVFVYHLKQGQWLEQTKLTANRGGSGLRFGRAVAISGERLVVGAPTPQEISFSPADSGAAYVYRLKNGDWLEEARLRSSFLFKFGQSVDLEEEQLIIGAPYSISSIGAGGAQVFKRKENSWREETLLFSPAGSHFAQFGFSVAIAGDRAVVGAPYDLPFGVPEPRKLNSGVVYLFEKTEQSWEFAALLHPSDGDSTDRFGRATALAERYTIAGAPGKDADGRSDAGAAYIFENSALVGVQNRKGATIPSSFVLEQNYPNPFNPVTTIRYRLATRSTVELSIYNRVGQRVRVLIDAPQSPGIHRIAWNGRNAAGELLPSGIYFYRMRAGQIEQTRKMLLLQ